MARGVRVLVRDRHATAAVEYAVLFGALAVAIMAAAGPVMTDMGERLAKIPFGATELVAPAPQAGIPPSCGFAATCQGTVASLR